jgi:hypothetical protein
MAVNPSLDRVNHGRRTAEGGSCGPVERPEPISSHASASPGAASGRGRPAQARSGIARSRASAAVQPIAHGQRASRWRVVRRAERLGRPARLNHRRRSVLVVTIPAPRPSRAVQRALVMGNHLDREPGAVRGELPGWQVVEPHAVLQAPDRVLDLGVAAMVGLEFEQRADPVGDERVIPAMKDAFQPDRPTRIVARPGQGLWTGHHPNGLAGMTMDLESDVISGRPCDSPGCALSADP